MDTTIYLISLLTIKDQPGSVPLIKQRSLDLIEHTAIIDKVEKIFHLAASTNEVYVVDFLLRRYNIDPNDSDLNESNYSSYMYAMMFDCKLVLDLMIKKYKLYPESWYLLFLFAKIHQNYDIIHYCIEHCKEHIKLNYDER